jgi:alpha-beta hydrolase superfamily lysophospholipase
MRKTMNTLYTINQSTLLNILEPWEFQVSSGFVVRGYKSTPSGKPVIHFIHGNGYSGLVYQQLLLTLSKHYDLFLINIQGHGNSDLGGYFRGWNENARYCLEAWNYFKREWQTVPRIAMGHSLGGILSLLMMSENVLAFDKAILLDPVLFTPLQMGFMSIAKPIGLLKKIEIGQANTCQTNQLVKQARCV